MESIGIMGSSRGCGTSHFGLALLTYYASGCLKPVEYFDFSGNHQLEVLLQEEGNQQFVKAKVKVNPSCLGEDFLSIKNNLKGVGIFDFGNGFTRYREEYFSCDRSLAVVNLSLMHYWEYVHFAQEVNAYGDNSRKMNWYQFFHGQQKPGVHKTKVDKTIKQIPIIANPLCIEEEAFVFFTEEFSRAAKTNGIRKRFFHKLRNC